MQTTKCNGLFIGSLHPTCSALGNVWRSRSWAIHRKKRSKLEKCSKTATSSVWQRSCEKGESALASMSRRLPAVCITRAPNAPTLRHHQVVSTGIAGIYYLFGVHLLWAASNKCAFQWTGRCGKRHSVNCITCMAFYNASRNAAFDIRLGTVFFSFLIHIHVTYTTHDAIGVNWTFLFSSSILFVATWSERNQRLVADAIIPFCVFLPCVFFALHF